ncbi:MAG: hypothetical protein K0Q72_2902 [Armatimonadetes bacterium]|nr:hypothetical protein [Armatimonadota bacterium]
MSGPFISFFAFGAFCAQLAAGLIYVGRSQHRRPLVTVALAHLSGAAAVGLGVTLSLLVSDRVHVAGPTLCLAALAVIGWLRFRGRGRFVEVPSATSDSPVAPGMLVWLLYGLLGLGIATAVARVALLPLDWDGWAFWQFKARAMTDGSLRRLLTAPEFGFGHPDYPLLNPANTWWLGAGRFEPKLAQCSGLLFFADLLVLTYAGIRRRASHVAALTGCVVLISWPPVMKHAASGFSDLLLAAYVLAFTLLLMEGELAIALACLTGALLTKNEGLFTFAGATAIAGLLAWRGRNPDTTGPRGARGPLYPAAVLVTGLVVAGAWTVIKRRWSLSADLLDPSQWPTDFVGAVLRRVPVVGLGFRREWLSVGPKYPGWGLFWPVAVLGLVLSVRRRLEFTAPCWLMAGAHLAGTVAAYLLTPLDPALHLSRSLDRLLLHVAPTLLVAALLAVTAIPGDEDAPHRPQSQE